MLFYNKQNTASAWRFFFFILKLTSLTFSIPCFLFYVINESANYELTLTIVPLVLCMCIFAGVIFAIVLWLIFEPMRKRRRILRPNKGDKG